MRQQRLQHLSLVDAAATVAVEIEAATAVDAAAEIEIVADVVVEIETEAATVADAVAAIEIAALAPTIAVEATDLLVRNQLLRQAPHRLQSQ